MPPKDFTRPREGFRFLFDGMKLNARADALPPNKYPLAVNVREYERGTIRCRPGLGAPLFAAGGGITHVTDLRGYAALNTDNLPRIVSHISDDTVWVDTIGNVGVLAASAGIGASMIPFRPGASPTPYMYIANGSDYQKFSAPNVGVVTQKKTGIAEPQTAPDVAISTVLQGGITPALTYTAGGTAGASANSTRFSDTVGAAVFKDPASGSGTTSNYPIFSLQVGNAASYQKLAQFAIFGSAAYDILDVFPNILPNNVAISVSSIFYFTGSTGRCVIVASIPGKGTDISIYAPLLSVALRRGAIIKIGTESVFVLSVTSGPDNTYAIETSTVNTHTTADTIVLIPSISVVQAQQGGPFTPAPGNTIVDVDHPRSYQITTGVGTQTSSAFTNQPFLGGPVFSTAQAYQADDYLSFGFKIIDAPQNLVEMKLLFDVDDGSFTKNFYYYTVRASDIASAIANAVTQIAATQTAAQRAIVDEENAIFSANQGVTFSGAQGPTGVNTWIQIVFPISQLTRVGTDQTKSLFTFTKFQVLWNVSGTVNVVQDASFFPIGGFAPDVGDVGAPYRYRVRPRDSTTGVVGNPSPATRYDVSPRRMSVLVDLPSAAYDPQIDTWDVFRYGGSVTEWRFIGSTPSSNTTFVDNFSDDAALAGDILDFDNFEPWPSIDVPFSNTATSVTGFTALITSPSSIVTRYLPGTLIQLGNINVYTLQTRPTLKSGSTYLFQFVENAGTQTNVRAVIQEPILARQNLPYMWGPDANGNVFACGDPLRLGTLYFCKPYAPDSAPDAYNQEIVQPTEPLLGGETVDGVSYVASTERWWRLYFQPDNPEQRFSPVQEPFPRGLAAPFGHCNDGQSIYYWAKDGIWKNDQSLTDADLSLLFPHEGVNGQDIIYNGTVIPAPDYSQAAFFRLTYSNGFLYAIYKTVNATYANPVWLVLNLRTGAWDFEYSTLATGHITCAYHVEQQKESSGALNPVLLFGAQNSVYQQTDLANDGSGAGALIPCFLAVREFDGGDVRAPKQWGDYFLDLVPAAVAGVSATPVSLGAGIAVATIVPSGATRVRKPVSVGNAVLVSDFLGLFLSWNEDFSRQTIPTQIFVWQPSFDVQPANSIAWQTFGASYGLQGYGHLRQIAIAWVSTAPITLTIVTVDGQDPQVITIPSSAGLYNKQLFPVSANKGQLFIFKASSAAPFQIFEDDIEIFVGQWGRSGPYLVAKSFGGISDAGSPI